MFSMISTFAFHGDTSKFLLMLAIVTCALNFVSFFFVRLLPPSRSTLPTTSRRDHLESQVLRRAKSHDGQGQNPTWGGEPNRGPSNRKSIDACPNQVAYDGAAEEANIDTHETSSLLSKSSDSGPEEYGFERRASKDDLTEKVDIRGLALLTKSKFWQLFLMFGLLTGIGLMNIK
jgi:hypothetical protein